MPPWKRAIQVLLIATAALAGVYLVGGNLFLAFGLPRILSKPSLMLGYLSAWTVWPGRVHVKDFHVQGQSDTVEWKLAAAEGVVDINLWALTRREVHLHDVHVDGLRFRFRLRVMPDAVDDPKVQALPPIAPYEDPPVRLAGAVGPELIDGKYRHWVTQIDDSEAEVNEIWVGPARFLGRARSRGGFYIASHRAIAITPATLDVSDGVLTFARQEAAVGVEGQITCTVDRFHPDELHGRSMLRAFSSDVKLDAQIPSLDFMKMWIPAASARIEGGGGPMHVEASMRHGRLLPQSLLHLQNDKLVVHAPGFEVHADGKVDWRTLDDERTVIHALISEGTIKRLGVEVPPVAVTDATADYTTQDGDLAEGLAYQSLSAKLARAQGDIRWITRVRAGEKVRFETGRFAVSEDLDLDQGFNAKSHAKATMTGVSLLVKDARLRGDLAATATVSSTDVVKSRRFSIDSGSATLSPATVEREGDRTRLTARADIESGDFDFRNGFEMKLGSHAVVTGTGAVLDLVGAPRLAKAAAALFAASTATASAKMAYQGGVFALKIDKGSSGITHVKGEVRTKEKATEMAFVVRADPFSLGISLEGGHVQTAPEPGDKWLDEHRPKLTPDAHHPAAVAERVR